MLYEVITPKEFAKEIKVVMEERRMRTDDKPQALVYETLMSSAFQAHPYRRPIIGWMNDLEHMTADDVRDWYKRCRITSYNVCYTKLLRPRSSSTSARIARCWIPLPSSR